MNLKEQTVYIPSIEAIESGIIVNAEYTSIVENFGVREVVYLPQKLQEKQLICLSKEELIELLNNVYDDAYKSGLSGYPISSLQYKYGKDYLINSLINNEKNIFIDKKNEWVDVDYKLPKTNKTGRDVLTYSKGHFDVHTYYDSQFFKDHFRETGITHWQELPSPPKLDNTK